MDISFIKSLSLETIMILLVAIVFFAVAFALLLSSRLNALLKIAGFSLIQFAIYVSFYYLLQYNHTIHLLVGVPSALLGFLLFYFVSPETGKKGKKDPNWGVDIPLAKGGNLTLDNIRRGVIIFGSAGSGKTESCFVPIIKHAGERNFPALCYDYKSGELTEIANFFYQNSPIKKYTIVPHNPAISDRVNPFAPRYITSEQHLRQQTKLIFSNLKRADGQQKGGGHNFFDKIPESTLAAVIWRLMVDYPDYCTLPHAVAFCLRKDPTEIAEFIKKNEYSRAIGTPLIDSLTSENQIAGVKASLSLPLTDLAVPPIFYVLGGDEVDLDINNPEHPAFLSVINEPSLEKVNAPFISVIVSTTINQMQIRNRPPSLLLFDEGTTFSIDNISRIPATMRSYNIATIFSTQDKALAKENYGDVITNSLLANLSYQIIGKTNDPESVKYYKQLSEEIEKKTTSTSFKGGLINSDTRYSESSRETSKFKNQDFTRLKPGQFFVFADGNENLYNLKLIPYTRIESKVKHHVTKEELNRNFTKIFDEAFALD